MRIPHLWTSGAVVGRPPITHWLDGGPTDLNNLVLLDPHRVPQRGLLHQRE